MAFCKEPAGKVTRAAIGDSKDRLSGLDPQLPGLAFAFDAGFRISRATDDLIGRLGLSPEEVIGRRLTELASEQSARRLVEAVWPTLVETGEVRDIAVQFVARPHETVETLATFRVIRDQDGRFLCGLASLTEVSPQERRRREHEFAVDALSFGTWTWDLGADQIMWSERARKLLGVSPDQNMTYEAFLAVVHPEDRASLDEAIRRSLAGRREYDLCYRCIWPDGSLRWIEARGGGHWDDAGRLMYLHGALFDITERREAEARLDHAQRLSALGQLTGGVAHDFNSVLQMVSSAAQLVQSKIDDRDAVLRYAGLMQQAVERGSSVTRRLLGLARREASQLGLVDAACFLSGLPDMLRHTIGPGISITVDVQPELPAFLADVGQLEAVLVNLATNARDAMPHGGTVTLSAAANIVAAGAPSPEEPVSKELAPGPYICLAVADTGMGMDAATLRRATEPFFTTKPAGKGTGLGLGMARVFAEQSCGRLHVDSVLGVGTTVTLWLPAAPEG